ncbi:O-antigen ligase family protein [Endozoicomonas ascidiicola]|uniref:O-antigen ligase family protein n=1 Tax=Endozoicomonas ascidiicola TaxID=1698521 RepID=UPI0012F77BC1|nr:O-antigen ligase family protein [Endozoicomonas ascidiicola]
MTKYLFNDEFSFKKLYLPFYLFLALICLLGLYEGLTKQHFIPAINQWGDETFVGSAFRVYTFFGHPNDYGYYLLFFISFVTLGLYLGVFKKNFSTIFFLIILYSNLVLTISMGPLLSFIVSFILLFQILNLKNKWLYLIFALFFVFMSYLTIGEVMTDRVFNRIEASIFSYHSVGESATRVDFYLQSIPVLLENFFFGVGPGSFGGWVATQFDSYAHYKYNISTYGLRSIDVFYPHLFGELGFFGGISFLTIYIIIIRRSILQYKFHSIHDGKFGMLLSANVLFCVFLILISAFWTMLFETNGHMILLWSFVGSSEGYYIFKCRNSLNRSTDFRKLYT